MEEMRGKGENARCVGGGGMGVHVHGCAGRESQKIPILDPARASPG